MSAPASVQTAHLALEAIEDDVLRLAGDDYRAVLEVGSVNFGLQGEAEQEVVVASFAAFLNGLTFPIQILVRVLPVNVDGYLHELEEKARRLPDELAELARDYVTFLRKLARNRTLLERRFYLVVPAELETSNGRQGWPFNRKVQTPGMEAARRQLTLRCEEVERQVGRCGLTARRLSTGEISELIYACWCPDLARVQRLRHDLHDLGSVVTRAGLTREGRT
jgi:hypothetical protein